MFDLLVAFRFLKEGRMQTVLILVGISVGIAVQVFLNSLIVGLQKDLVLKTVGNAAHITATMPDLIPAAGRDAREGRVTLARVVTNEGSVKPIRDWAPVAAQLEKSGEFTAISPAARGSGFILQGQKSLPILLQGFDLDKADALYSIRGRMTAGRFEVGGNNVLIGRALAEKLRIGIGSALRITIPSGTTDLFSVAGIFDLQVQAVNESWAVVSLPRAQALFGFEGGITDLELQVKDVFSAERRTRSLKGSYPGLKWQSWQETNASLLTALQSQSSSSYIIQLFVLLSVTLGISSVLAVSAVQKSRQIGILKAIGTPTRKVSRIFVIQGAALGFSGSFVGAFAGYGLIKFFQHIGSGGGGQRLFPIVIEPGALLLSVAVATLAGTIAAVVPARRAARLNPIEVIRNG
jgi:lipoprotein-releasing system permease protein